MPHSPTSLSGDAAAAAAAAASPAFSEPHSVGPKAPPPAYREPPTRLSLDHMRQIIAIDIAMTQQLESVGSVSEFSGSLDEVLGLAKEEFESLSTRGLGDANTNDAIKRVLLLDHIVGADSASETEYLLPRLNVLKPLLNRGSALEQAIAAALDDVEFVRGGGAAESHEAQAFVFDAALVAAREKLASMESENSLEQIFRERFPFIRQVLHIFERLLGAQVEKGLEPHKAGLQPRWYHGFGMLLSLGALSAAALPWVPQTSSVVLGFLATHGVVFNAVTLPIATIALAAFAAYVLVEIGRQMRAQREVRRLEDKSNPVLESLEDRAHPLGQINAMMFLVGVLAAVGGSFFIVANAMTYLSALPMLAQGGIVIGAAFLASVAMTGLVAVVSHMKAPVQEGYQVVAGDDQGRGLGLHSSRTPSLFVEVPGDLRAGGSAGRAATVEGEWAWGDEEAGAAGRAATVEGEWAGGEEEAGAAGRAPAPRRTSHRFGEGRPSLLQGGDASSSSGSEGGSGGSGDELSEGGAALRTPTPTGSGEEGAGRSPRPGTPSCSGSRSASAASSASGSGDGSLREEEPASPPASKP